MLSKNLCKTLLLTLCVLAVSAYGENLVTNPGFEDGTTGWSGRGCMIEAVTEGAHSGNGCAKALDRMDAWQGIKQDMLDKMENGKTYKISGWAKLAEAGSDTVTISIEKADDAGTKYHNIAKATVTDANWVEISGNFKYEASGFVSVLDLYFEGPAAGANFLVDDVSVTVTESSAPAAGSGEKKTVNLMQFDSKSLCQKSIDVNDIPSEEPNEPNMECNMGAGCKKKEDPNGCPKDPNDTPKKCEPKFKGISIK